MHAAGTMCHVGVAQPLETACHPFLIVPSVGGRDSLRLFQGTRREGRFPQEPSPTPFYFPDTLKAQAGRQRSSGWRRRRARGGSAWPAPAGLHSARTAAKAPSRGSRSAAAPSEARGQARAPRSHACRWPGGRCARPPWVQHVCPRPGPSGRGGAAATTQMGCGTYIPSVSVTLVSSFIKTLMHLVFIYHSVTRAASFSGRRICSLPTHVS